MVKCDLMVLVCTFFLLYNRSIRVRQCFPYFSACPNQLLEYRNNMKQKNKKTFRILLAVFLIVVLVVLAGLLWLFLSVGKGSTEDPASAGSVPVEESSPSTVVVSDQDLEKLISGDLTLDDLAQDSGEITFEPEDASSTADENLPDGSSEAASAASKPQNAASSSSASTDPKAPTAGSSSSTSGTTAGSSSQKQPAGYEAEIKALLQQVYAVKARAESGLNSCIDSAKAQYDALPDWQKNQATKVMIVASKTAELTSLQSSCDKEMEQIVGQMRKVLQENGQSTALADQVMATYNQTKSSRYNELKNKLYS